MKKLLLASVLAIASTTAMAADPYNCGPHNERCDPSDIAERADFCRDNPDDSICGKPPARVTVTPQVYGPPPIGWVYGPYTQCANPPQCSMGVVDVDASGLNVRVAPDAYSPPVMALVNGTPLYPMDKKGDWLLVAPACDLTPTWAWSWNAGVPLNRCWVYF
jgi:hypothetical protein